MEIFGIIIVLLVMTVILVMLIALGILVIFNNEDTYDFLMRASFISLGVIMAIYILFGIVTLSVELLKLMII